MGLYNYQIRPTSIVIYSDRFHNSNKRYSSSIFLPDEFFTNESDDNNEVKKSKTYSGEITKGSRKRLLKALELFFFATPTVKIFNPIMNQYTNFRSAHLTLTLSGHQGDYTDSYLLHNLFTPYLRYLIRRFGIVNYVWKAETQENGNIHWHVIIDKFIHFQIYKDTWNRFQSKFKFIDDFKNKYGHSDPNSTDVHYVRSQLSVQKYISKYISKPENDRRKLTCKLWSASKNLLLFKYPTFDFSADEELIIDKIIKKNSVSIFESDFFTYVKFDNHRFISTINNSLNLDLFSKFAII